MSSFSDLYGLNTTNPLPPLMSSTTSAISVLNVFILLSGFVLSLLLLFCISRLTTASNRALREVQGMLTVADMLLYLTFAIPLTVNAYHRQVPSQTFCQAQGVAVHFFATGNFTTITFSVIDRHYRLCQIRDSSTKSSGTAPTPAHWRVYKYAVLPLLLVHALLPVLTSGGYGVYVPKPNNNLCYAGGGRGVFAHDVFPAMNVGFFLSCSLVVMVLSWRTVKIIRGLLSASNVQSTAATKKRVEAERKAMWYAGTTTLLFLTGEYTHEK
jgi:hypothetical protein